MDVLIVGVEYVEEQDADVAEEEGAAARDGTGSHAVVWKTGCARYGEKHISRATGRDTIRAMRPEAA